MADKVLTRRSFLKGLSAVLGGAGAGELVAGPRPAEAVYIPGTPSDTVDTNLTVQGQLIVQQRVGIGTTTPQGQLEVAGEIRSAIALVIAPDGRGKQCYYVTGPALSPLPTFNTGSWGRVKATTWDCLQANSWDQVQTVDGSWQRAAGYSWSLVSGGTWGGLSAGVWDQAPPPPSAWDRVGNYSWSQLGSMTWQQVQTL